MEVGGGMVSLGEFREFKERSLEGNKEIRERLASIDASISSLTPLITAHEERFKILELSCKINDRRTSRVEQGIIGAMVIVVVGGFSYFINGVLGAIFPPKVVI